MEVGHGDATGQMRVHPRAASSSRMQRGARDYFLLRIRGNSMNLAEEDSGSRVVENECSFLNSHRSPRVYASLTGKEEVSKSVLAILAMPTTAARRIDDDSDDQTRHARLGTRPGKSCRSMLCSSLPQAPRSPLEAPARATRSG